MGANVLPEHMKSGGTFISLINKNTGYVSAGDEAGFRPEKTHELGVPVI